MARYVARIAAEADRSAAVDRCAVVDHCVVVGRDAAADRCVAPVLQIVAFHDVAPVVIRAAPSVVQNVAQNVVRRFSLDDFRLVAPAGAPVEVSQVAQFVAHSVAQLVAQLAARFVARDCSCAGFRLPAGRAAVSPLLPASSVAHEPVDPDVDQALPTQTEFAVD